MEAISRALAVSVETGRIARPAIAIPARAASRVPPSTPPPRNSHSRLMVASRLSVLRAYWTKNGSELWMVAASG